LQASKREKREGGGHVKREKRVMKGVGGGSKETEKLDLIKRGFPWNGEKREKNDEKRGMEEGNAEAG